MRIFPRESSKKIGEELNEILRCSLDLILKTFGLEVVLVYLLEKEKGKLSLRFQVGLPSMPREMVEEIFLESFSPPRAYLLDKEATGRFTSKLFQIKVEEYPKGKVQQILRKEKFKYLLNVPILLDGKFIGVTTFGLRSSRQFTPRESELLVAFCKQIGMIVNHAFQVETIQKRLKEITQLQKVSQKFNATLNLKELLNLICQSVVEVLGFKMCWIGLIREGTFEVLPLSHAGFEEEYLSKIKVRHNDSPLGQGPTGMAIKTKEPQFQRDIDSDPNYQPWRREALKKGYRSSAAFPLISRGKVLGALNIYSDKPDAFKEEKIPLLKAFSAQAAVAIENAQLYLKIEKERREKELIAHRALKGIEQERKLLSAELHDSLLQILVSLFYSLEALKKKELSKDLKKKIEKLAKTTQSAIDLGRSIVTSLRPPYLGNIGLVAALRALLESTFLEEKIKVQFQVDKLPALDYFYEIVIYRIFQEAITNIKKHAKAKNVFAHLKAHPSYLELLIQDDGKGFSLAERESSIKTGHIGLLIMKERAALVDGAVKVESKLGQGTTVKGIFPLKKTFLRKRAKQS